MAQCTFPACDCPGGPLAPCPVIRKERNHSFELGDDRAISRVRNSHRLVALRVTVQEVINLLGRVRLTGREDEYAKALIASAREMLEAKLNETAPDWGEGERK